MTDTESIRFSVEGTAADAAFLELTVGERLLHERLGHWPTSAREIPDLGQVVASHRRPGRTVAVIRRDDGAVRIRLENARAHAMAACATPEGLRELWAILRHRLPPPEAVGATGGRTVPIDFWSTGFPLPASDRRELAVPDWAEIAGNYAPATAGALDRLLARELPLEGGGLVLWHGPPGTGKTSALRALAGEWRDRVRVEFVTDPDALLSQPRYLQMVIAGDREEDATPARWRLIVLEDAGELLAPDAKERTGQGLARLLNLTDGLVGQESKVLVLITGNEPFEHLHPAVARPGRCTARIEFRPFDAAGASAWLRAHGIAGAAPAGTTLAELYARLRGEPPARSGPGGFGFARGLSEPAGE